jgi:AcrR family transcriptional regulator
VTSTLPPEPTHRGRPRDASRDEAIRRAALELVAEVGYDRLTMELVAARAKAGKATIYRRWSSKAELVVDALTLVKPVVASIDTGSLEGDMAELVGAACSKHSAFATSVMCGIASSLGRDPELLEAYRQFVTAPRITRIFEVLARARERGELGADIDIEFAATIVPSLVLQRTLITGAPVERTYIEDVVAKVLRPMLGLPITTSETP